HRINDSGGHEVSCTVEVRPWIPRSFDLMHRKVQVSVSPEVHANGYGGEARHYECRILMSPDAFNPKMFTPEEAGCTFWHEVWHHLMSVLSERELKDNEKLADQFGGLMAQLMATADWRAPESAGGEHGKNA
ncbi:MAG TPA: hypothetical protein VM223_11775, partial [Planctomycetota bacterium]|nr:hypothetical protein [Planctomycetota bacterium]